MSTEVPMSMMLRVSTTCCCLPSGSGGTLEASSARRVASAAWAWDVPPARRGEADEGQYAPVLARGDEWCAWSGASAVRPVASSHHEPDSTRSPWDLACVPILQAARREYPGV